jgi:hypothetical protein
MESCEFKKRFPDLTENQVCDLAQLGKSISSISNSLVLSLLFISKEMLISESDIAEKARYCMSDLMDLTRYLVEYRYSEA